MEEDLILQQPSDRRLGTGAQLPPGPPGAEFDNVEFDSKNAPKKVEKESSGSKSSRRRSPSSSPVRKRKSPSRNRRSPSPISRRRRSPSPRRNRFRDYSPDRRRYDRRRSPDRRRTPRRGGGGRFGRGRARSDSSRSRSHSPPHRRGGGGGGGGGSSRSVGGSGGWSPKKKPNSPNSNVQSVMGGMPPQVVAAQTQAASRYGVMPPQMYGAPDGYVRPPPSYQYSVPPPTQAAAFVTQATADAFGMQGGPPPNFNTAYPPPTWDAYSHQPWMQPPPAVDAIQMQPPPVGPTANATLGLLPTPTPKSVNPQSLSVLPDAAPGTVEANPAHDAAVAQEAENQRDELKKQRASYQMKTVVLRKELKMLKEQRKDLHTSGGPPSPTTKGFIDENEKLQSQIQKKLNTIENVIDMLTGIIGEENLDKSLEPKSTQLRKPSAPMAASVEAYESAATMNTSKERSLDAAAKEKDKAKAKATPNECAEQTVGVKDGGGGGGSGRHHQHKQKRSASISQESTSDSTTSGTGNSTSSEDGSSTENDDDDDDDEEEENEEEDEDDDDDSSSPERLKNKVMESMKSKQLEAANAKKDPKTALKIKEEKDAEEKSRFNYVFYDPEMHWCPTCNIFPKTAKDFLNHLHTKDHINREQMETPWHDSMLNDQYPVFDNAPTKRIPIRGLPFFVPATAWFCKLCKAWMGDLHCASTHLKSLLHQKKYTGYLEKNPHYEVNWMADRQRVINENKAASLVAAQTTASSKKTAERNGKKAKRDDEKYSKKRKKRSSDKKDKKKRSKHSKKRKKNTGSSSTSSSSSSDSSSSDNEVRMKKKEKEKSHSESMSKESDILAPSRRIARAPNDSLKLDDMSTILPMLPAEAAGITGIRHKVEPSIKLERTAKWLDGAQESVKKVVAAAGPGAVVAPTALLPSAQQQAVLAAINDDADEGDEDDGDVGGGDKPGDSIGGGSQWSAVQPVISESEKKLLEQLKGKLKSKPADRDVCAGAPLAAVTSGSSRHDKDKEKEKDKDKDKENHRDKSRGGGGGGGGGGGWRRDVESDDRRRRYSRSPQYARGGRSRTRTRSRGRDYRRALRRSRSRGRNSPWGGRRRSRSRSLRRRSRSHDRRRRPVSRSRSRTRSVSRQRIEKAVVKHSEFRPRVPEKDKEKERRDKDSKDKKDGQKKSKSSNSANSIGTSAATSAGKKLPFIGKMPVFKKQTSGLTATEAASDKRAGEYLPEQQSQASAGAAVVAASAYVPIARQHVPTAAQIQMAMMEDVYGNAPPFHPDAGMMVDYEDLMPDPVQFVNLMGQAPPPPPPPASSSSSAARVVGSGSGGSTAGDAANAVDDEVNMLPPGIDEAESEEFVPKPISDAPLDSKGALPKDLEEALNIIFPGDKQPGDDDDEDEASKTPVITGQTNIIMDDPVMQAADLVKEGIHLVTIEETSMQMDEASQMSMNEPLIFNNKGRGAAETGAVGVAAQAPPPPPPSAAQAQTHAFQAFIDDSESSQNAADIDLSLIRPPLDTPPPPALPVVMAIPATEAGHTTDAAAAVAAAAAAAATSPLVNDVNGNSTDDCYEIASATANAAPQAIEMDVDNLPDIPMPDATTADVVSKIYDDVMETVVVNLDDIPQPPASPTESEKHRRQEELDDLAMLGIDADDMAAQCI